MSKLIGYESREPIEIKLIEACFYLVMPSWRRCVCNVMLTIVRKVNKIIDHSRLLS